MMTSKWDELIYTCIEIYLRFDFFNFYIFSNEEQLIIQSLI